jgi:hypothetical protein
MVRLATQVANPGEGATSCGRADLGKTKTWLCRRTPTTREELPGVAPVLL